MPKLTIDGKEIEVEEGLTLMQACEQAGKEIPHFCYHEKLNIAGNCRMCLVEMDKAPKPVASCAMNVADGMVVHTNTEKVQKARNGVMEFLLINHPLDCPICDQGGECDLQDQAFKYGSGASRFSENKRSVKDKDLGPLVKTHMTRCIHCTRCVRFSTEIAGVEEMGAIGRGENMQITSYLEKTLTSELSGNVIDLCPVGALTSKPYAFKARSWELEKTESVDVMDALGSNIRIDSVGLEVMRVLPKINEDINEEWLSDKARFSYDGLKNQRLDRPYKKDANGVLRECSWEEAIKVIASKMHSNLPKETHMNGNSDLSSMQNGDKFYKSKIAAIAGNTTACESMFTLRNMVNALGSNKHDANQNDSYFDRAARGNYLFNSEIAGLEDADLCLLIGANPRKVAPVLGARIGRLVRSGNIEAFRIGKIDDQTYPITELGNKISVIQEIISGKHSLAKKLSSAKNPVMIIGDGVFRRPDAAFVQSMLHELADKYGLLKEDWNGFNILHNHASSVGALDLSFVYDKDNIISKNVDPTSYGTSGILKQTREGDVNFLYLLGADEINTKDIGDDCFVVYQGHHGDNSVNRADVVLPSAAYTEQDAIYVNMEGRAQYARKAVAPPNMAKEDYKIFDMIALELKSLCNEKNTNEAKLKSELDLMPANLQNIREAMAKESDVFANIDQITSSLFKKQKPPKGAKLQSDFLGSVMFNYYMTDSISRNSASMAKCTKAILSLKQGAKENTKNLEEV